MATEEEGETIEESDDTYNNMILRIAEEPKQGKSMCVYRPLAHVCPSSVIVERLFSDA